MLTISHTRGLATWPDWMATALLVSMSLLVVSGCGSQGPPKPVNFGADIFVTEDLNPDTNGRPSPLMLAVYQIIFFATSYKSDVPNDSSSSSLEAFIPLLKSV